jgi:hypothetical protein
MLYMCYFFTHVKIKNLPVITLLYKTHIIEVVIIMFNHFPSIHSPFVILRQAQDERTENTQDERKKKDV